MIAPVNSFFLFLYKIFHHTPIKIIFQVIHPPLKREKLNCVMLLRAQSLMLYNSFSLYHFKAAVSSYLEGSTMIRMVQLSIK